MRTFLTAVMVVISALLGVCVAILGTLVVNFVHMMQKSGPATGIAAMAGSVSEGTITICAVVGGLAGYLLARLFLTKSVGQ